MPVITIQDQSLGGKSTHELTIDILTEQITVRELIRSRVYQEVHDFNRKQHTDNTECFRGLVQPNATEKALNGGQSRKVKLIDWKAQYELACDAFMRNRFFILIDDYQPTDLEEQITLSPKTVVNFVKLVPLVGG